jgi:type IV pilus assembly protein PilA
MQHIKSKKGFTLVEIMIVVVIIGLLAAMAIPAFQKVRTNSISKTIINDGRQIGSAAQQYFMDNGVATVTFNVSTDGSVTGPLTDYVGQISQGVGFDGTLTAGDPNAAIFTLSHSLGNITFDAEGKVVTNNF